MRTGSIWKKLALFSETITPREYYSAYEYRASGKNDADNMEWMA
jgi:hypothetical protein